MTLTMPLNAKTLRLLHELWDRLRVPGLMGYDRRVSALQENPRTGALPQAVVVIPCYNAGKRLLPVLEALGRLGVSAVVVDDGSTDGSADAAEGLPGARRVRFGANRGKGHALLAGIEAALSARPNALAVALMDADGQHDPAELERIVRPVLAGEADLAIGQRNFRLGSVPFASWLGNRVTSLLALICLGAWIPDTQCGYRVLSPRFARLALQCVPGGRYETETAMLALALRGGFRVARVPISTRYEPGNRGSHFRKVGDSLRVLGELFRSAWRYRAGISSLGEPPHGP